MSSGCLLSLISHTDICAPHQGHPHSKSRESHHPSLVSSFSITPAPLATLRQPLTSISPYTMLLQAVLAISLASVVRGKVYERCELARELIDKHEAAEQQVATWVCIAQHESQFNTSAVGHLNSDNSGDHGIFQISDLFWCSPPGNGWACGVTCAELEDDDIEDDFICARRIYREHKKLSGNGFNAWVVYHTHCSGDVQSYIEGCFDTKLIDNDKLAKEKIATAIVSSTTAKISTESTTTAKSAPTSTTTTISETINNELSHQNLRSNTNYPWFIWFNKLNWK